MSQSTFRETTPPGLSGGGGGGIAQGPGTAIADNKIVRGDTAGIEGLLALVSDSGVVTADSLLIYQGGNQSNDERVQIGGGTCLFAADMPLRWYNDSDISQVSADSGFVRSAAGTMKVTNGGAGNGRLMIGGATCRGLTTSAAAATTTNILLPRTGASIKTRPSAPYILPLTTMAL